MNISAIIAATILVAAVGLFIGVFLGAAGKKFAVEIDEKEVAIREALPGNNCGGCGYPGCDGLAAAIAKGEAPVNRCPVGGEPVGKIIAGIMGQAAVETARQVAHVKCSGTCEKAKEEYIYTGVEDCEMLPFVPNGGAKTCTYGFCGTQPVKLHPDVFPWHLNICHISGDLSWKNHKSLSAPNLIIYILPLGIRGHQGACSGKNIVKKIVIPRCRTK